jgi:hypothetical protein
MVFGTGCNDHPIGGYDDGPQIGGAGDLGAGAAAELDRGAGAAGRHRGGARVQRPGGRDAGVLAGRRSAACKGFTFPGGRTAASASRAVEIDLTMNCLEVWSEEPGRRAQMSIHSFFRVSIDEDDQSLLTEQFFSGCP